MFLANHSSQAPLWHLLTRLGEAQILLPLALASGLWLRISGGQGALARRWALALLGAALLTLGSKLAFFGWGLGSADWDFTCFSGHAMIASAILPVLAWMAALRLGAGAQRLAALLGLALAGLIAYSRLAVHAHSVSEALSGFVLGVAVSAVALRGAVGRLAGPPLWLPLALLAWLALMPVGAPPSRTHDWVQQLSMQLSGRVPPYTRAEMHWRARLTRKTVAQRQCGLASEKACDQSW